MKLDSNLRSMAKTVSWRFLGSACTGILVMILTGNMQAAFVVGGTEAVLKMILYFFHERIWNRVAWGKVPASQKIFAVIENDSQLGSTGSELKSLLLKLQKPAVILDSVITDGGHSSLSLKWVKEVADHSIYPIFIFKEWNDGISDFLSQFTNDVIVINRQQKLLTSDLPFRIVNQGPESKISLRSLQSQLALP